MGAVDEFYQRCFAGAGLTHDGNGLARLHVQVYVLQHAAAGCIAKAHMLERHGSAHGFAVAAGILVQLTLCTNQLKNSFRTGEAQ